MSAPDTNIDKQKRRHWPPLAGFGVALAAILAVVIGVTMVEPENDAAPAVTSQPDQ